MQQASHSPSQRNSGPFPDPVACAAICFDLDGTLVDSEGDAADAIAVALRSVGRTMTMDERAFVVGHAFGEIYDQLIASGPLPLSREQLEDAILAARVDLLAQRGAQILPGAQDVVRWAAGHFRLALVTGSTRREALLMLDALGVADCFSVTLCAGEYGHGKPAPDPYLAGVAALGLAPRECVAVEDSTAGITSARAAGLYCVAVRAGNRFAQDQSHAHRILDSLADLPVLLSTHISGPGRRTP